MSNGRYTSTLLIYTEFSSKLPPRTLYCDDSSLCVDTPACCCISSSTALPDAVGTLFMSFMSRRSVPVVCRRFSVTTTSPNACMDGSCTSTCIFPFGRRNTRFRALYPTIENFTTTLSPESRDMLNSPFRSVITIFPCSRHDTVANSIGLFSSSTTRPVSVNPSAKTPVYAVVSIMSSAIYRILK